MNVGDAILSGRRTIDVVLKSVGLKERTPQEKQERQEAEDRQAERIAQMRKGVMGW